MKHFLTITFNQKDTAKADAKKNNTIIKWDSKNKKWFWEGETLPEFLKKYTYQTTKAAYKSREKSFDNFLQSSPGKSWTKKQEKIAATDMGFNSIDEMKKEIKKQENERLEEIKKEFASTKMCNKCMWIGETNSNNCPECNSNDLDKF